MWTELVSRLYPEHEFRAPAMPSHLAAAETSLGASLPAALRDLLLESDGVLGPYGLGLVWPIEQIVKDNLEFRSYPDFRELYMPFDPLLFFADAGNGDQFAFRVLERAVRGADIYVWNHEDDSRTWVAPDLGRYLEWWSDGRITT
jgi:hypothetical protein